MTSRRSRLKAVANLPVRRKLPGSQGTTNETTTHENLTSERALPLSPKIDRVIVSSNNICQNYESENNCFTTDIQTSLVNNCASSLENSAVENIEINENVKIDSAGILENNNDLNRNCNLNGDNVGESNSSLLNANKCFKPNTVSIIKERGQAKISNICEGNQSLEKLSADDILINKNNNIIEDGAKCYTILTPQNKTVIPVSNYTITTLTPYVNTGSTPTETDLFTENDSVSVDFDGIQIHTEVIEPTVFQIKMPNEFIDSSKSITELEPVAPALNKNLVDDINIDLYCNESNSSESINMPQKIFIKPSVRNGPLNANLNVNVSEECFKNPVTTVRDKPTGVTNTHLSQNVPPELNSFKQSITSIRRKRSKCNDVTKKLADARREFRKKHEKTKPDRSTLKMRDLIFYNPTTNPMESKAKFEKKESSLTQTDLVQEMLTEEKVDEPEPLDSESGLQSNDSMDSDNLSKMPVPQVKIGLNGEIILDEKSLIIETTDAKKGREDLQNSIPIFEERGSKVSYYRGKTRKTRDWTNFETIRFYKALNTIGPDFTLMQKYFPKRSRLELKNKFKREERLNRNLIDGALNNPSEFDMTQLEQDLAVEKKAEEEVEMRLCRGVKQASKRPRVRSSFLSREMVESDGESENAQSKAENTHSKKLMECEKYKKRKENNLILQKCLMKESETEINKPSGISSSSSGVFSPVDHGVT